jgi:protein required for attachment to host cells
MLTYKELGGLAEALRDQTVLSVYVNGQEADPAQRRRWRLDLRHSFDDIERWLKGSSHAEREAFAKVRRMVLEHLQGFRETIRSPGWVGFFTTKGEQHTSLLPVAMPTMAVWSTGPCLTPYVRAMKEARPVIVAVVDSRKAKLFRYVGRATQLVETVRAHVDMEKPMHMGKPPRLGFHHGKVGPTGRDEAQRQFREGTTRMLTEAVEKIAALAGDDAWVVFGGIPTVALAAMGRLGADLAARATHLPSLDVHATQAQVGTAAREAASALRAARDLERVNDALAGAESNGRGVAGSVDTTRALSDGQVREVFFTLGFLENHAAEAEAAIRLALDTHAAVEHVSGAPAERLEKVGGIAARLRYAAGNQATSFAEVGAGATGWDRRLERKEEAPPRPL